MFSKKRKKKKRRKKKKKKKKKRRRKKKKKKEITCSRHEIADKVLTWRLHPTTTQLVYLI